MPCAASSDREFRSCLASDTEAGINSNSRCPANAIESNPVPRGSFASHDANPHDAGFSQNALGRVAAVETGILGLRPVVHRDVQLHGERAVAKKRLRSSGRAVITAVLEASYSHDNEGRVTGITFLPRCSRA